MKSHDRKPAQTSVDPYYLFVTFSGKNLEGKNNCIVDLGYYSSQAKLNESISHIKLFKQQILNVPSSTIHEKNVSQAKPNTRTAFVMVYVHV